MASFAKRKVVRGFDRVKPREQLSEVRVSGSPRGPQRIRPQLGRYRKACCHYPPVNIEKSLAGKHRIKTFVNKRQ
jgi:hypothetical protein